MDNLGYRTAVLRLLDPVGWFNPKTKNNQKSKIKNQKTSSSVGHRSSSILRGATW
jgi:hypothetical protein